MAPKEQSSQSNVVPFQDRAVTYNVGTQEVKLTPNMVRQYLVTGNRDLVTDQEITYFMHICKSRGLNPFNKDCYLIKYTQAEGAAIIVSIEKLRMVARQSEDCVGWEKGVIVKKDNGELRYSKGLVLDGETLLGGYFKAKPKGWEVPFEIEVNLKGYIKKKHDGSVTRFWSPDNQPTMIAKVAEAQGLRTLWPEKTQGLYVSEEISSSHPTVDVDFSVIENGNGSGGESTEPTAPSFDAAAQAKGAGPEFDVFIKAIADGHRKPIDAVKSEVMASGRFDELWSAFENRAGQAKQAPTAAPAPSQPGNGNGVTPDPAARENWIRLRGPGYAEYIKSHIAAFRNAPSEILAEARGKWVNIYGTETPWSLDEHAPAAPAAPAPTQETAPAEDPMAGELDAMRYDLRGKCEIDSGIYLLQAQRDLKMPVGLEALPNTIDGCRALLDRVDELLAQRR